jgi:hypothetical protein
MTHLAPTSGGLHQNHSLGGTMWGDIQHELGIADRNDDIAMGWREEPGPGFVGESMRWGVSTFQGFLGGHIRGNFG